MTFIETVPEDGAPQPVAAMYEADRTKDGRVPNYTRAFSHAPEVYAAWNELRAAISARMPARRYELATLAAARRLRSSYCSLAHASALLNGLVEPAELGALLSDHRSAGLDELEVAVMDLADRVAADASAVTEADVERLRSLGLSDGEVFDVVATASLRCFFAKTLDGLGVQPDPSFAGLEPGLRDQLTVGRAIASA